VPILTGVALSVVIAPTVADRAAGVGELIAHLAGEQRVPLAQWQKRNDVRRLALRPSADASGLIWILDVDDPTALVEKLEASEHPFDRWLVESITYLHGLTPTQWWSIHGRVAAFDTAISSNAWRERT